MASRAAELRKARRQSSARAAPVYAAMLAVVCGMAWLARAGGVLYWIALIAAGVTAFGLLGDLANIVYCSLRLRRGDE